MLSSSVQGSRVSALAAALYLSDRFIRSFGNPSAEEDKDPVWVHWPRQGRVCGPVRSCDEGESFAATFDRFAAAAAQLLMYGEAIQVIFSWSCDL